MATDKPQGDREKVVSKLPLLLRQQLKVRTAQLAVDIQVAVSDGIARWRALGATPPAVDTAGAESFSTWLPPGQWEGFQADCKARGVSYIQGLAQAVRLWLDTHPSPTAHRPEIVRRFIVCNQKGGVGKTSVSAGLGEALAEDSETLYPSRRTAVLSKDEAPYPIEDAVGAGLRVLLVDFDPQTHLTKQLGATPLPLDSDSLNKHMSGEATGKLADRVVPIEDARFGGRLHLLPGCQDGFLLDVRLASTRAREAALERALQPLEADYDVVVIDCPPSLGLSMDAAVYYGRRRENEQPGASGILIVVQAEDSSADAYDLLTTQIEDLRGDMNIGIDYLGIVVNLYDGRRGYIATSSLAQWRAIGDPRVVAVIPDVKEQKEAVRVKQPLLAYAPRCEQCAGAEPAVPGGAEGQGGRTCRGGCGPGSGPAPPGAARRHRRPVSRRQPSRPIAAL
jgi:chromosome partitioning protein